MRELNGLESATVSGGAQSWKLDLIDGGSGFARDSYRACYDTDVGQSWSISNTASTWMSAAATGVSTAIADCANGGQVGAILGGGAGAGFAGVGAVLGAAIGGASGCVIGAGVGLIRDLGK
jgi:hypothetical protein